MFCFKKANKRSFEYCFKWRSAFTVKENLAGGETRRLSIAAPSHATPSPAAHKVDLGRRGRPNAQASVGFVPGAKARSAHQSRGLASLVRVTWCFDCSPHGSAGSTGRSEAVVGITCPKPAGRRCWVATAGDCTSPFRRAARPHPEAAVSRPAVVALLPSCGASASCRPPLRSPPFRLAAPVAITPQCLSAILLTRDHSVCRPPAGRPANQSPRDAPKSLSSPCRTVPRSLSSCAGSPLSPI